MPTLKNKDSKKEEKEWLSPKEREAKLSIDLYETEENLIVQSTISGVKAKDLNISVENEILTIKGSRQKNRTEEGKYLYQECYWGKFLRQVTLPEEVDASKIKASVDEGILTIVIPKIKKEDKKKIKVIDK
jgi:HSP20 family protein